MTIDPQKRKEYNLTQTNLAATCAAQLILACLDKGRYPSWDAANRESVALAEKLGYHFDREYVTYEITGFRQEVTP